MRYRHAWPGFLLLAALALLLVGLLQWGDHFLSPGPTGGIHRLLQLWAASRPPDEPAGAPPVAAAPASDPASTPPLITAPPAEPTPGPSASPSAAAPAGAASPSSGQAPIGQAPPTAAQAPPAAGQAQSVASAPPSSGPATPALPTERADDREAAPTPPSATTPAPARYALALGTFPVAEDAERVEAKLNQAGFSTVRFRQQAPAKLFAVYVSSIKDPEEGHATVERLQKDGFAQSAMLVGRSGVTVRVGAPTPLRTAVQLAEKLRGAGYDARVATETTRAGQVSLRHGNFASRAEAEAAGREIAKLGVPNEVIQVR